MDWQQPAALAVVGITAGLFARSWWRSRQPSWLRGGGCGCASAGVGKPPRVCVSGRRGEPPRVTVES